MLRTRLLASLEAVPEDVPLILLAAPRSRVAAVDRGRELGLLEA